MTVDAAFRPVARCWVCGGVRLTRYYQCRMDFTEFAQQDPGLHAYTGTHVWLVRCGACGFGQPEAIPTLPNYFDRMYDQRWSADWVEREFAGTYKDLIFARILRALARRRVPSRRLLDIGAHAGRFMSLAQRAGWDVEGIELNPRTAAYAAAQTGAPVHHGNVYATSLNGRRYGAVTLTDVLEHVPEPLQLLTSVATALEPGGVVAIKVPNGPAQRIKERTIAALTGRPMSLAENLVHVNHFSARSLALALRRAGFDDISVRTGAPELPPLENARARTLAARAVRLGAFGVGLLPGAVRTPIAFNLQAFATRTR